jgi:copper chaperone CopZ
MRTVTFETPAMYGDHHVKEVRRILTAVPGVQEVYASSAFRIVEVTFDEGQATEADLAAKLGETGYLDMPAFPQENGIAASEQAERAQSFFRHTQVFETSRQVVSFSQQVSYTGRPLWNCPGLGVIKSQVEE